MVGHKTKRTTWRAWRRVADDESSFGWVLVGATEHTTTTTSVSVTVEKTYDGYELKPNTETTTSRYIELEFARDTDDYVNLGITRVLEFFYEVASVLRAIAGAVLGYGLIALIAFRLLFNKLDEEFERAAIAYGVAVGIYVFLLMVERLTIGIARATLKSSDGMSGAVVTGGNYGENKSVVKRFFLSIGCLIAVLAALLFGLGIGQLVWGEHDLVGSGEVRVLSFFALSAIVLYLTIVTLIKLWKNKTSYFFFALLDIAVTFGLTVLGCILWT